MNDSLYMRIVTSTAHRESRFNNAGHILENISELQDLITFGCTINDNQHHKAMWILEIVVEKNTVAFVPYLQQFCNTLQLWKDVGAQRSAAKIAMIAVIANSQTSILNEQQLQQLTEQCFDWLIGDSKVAVKVYAIYALGEAGLSNKWIYAELEQILLKDYGDQSPGYKAAARKVLKRIHSKKVKNQFLG